MSEISLNVPNIVFNVLKFIYKCPNFVGITVGISFKCPGNRFESPKLILNVTTNVLNVSKIVKEEIFEYSF